MKYRSIFCAAAAVMTIAGCSGGTSATASAGDENAIKVWCWDENFNVKAMEVAKEMYMETNPDADIEVVTMAQDDIVQKLNTSLSSGNVDSLPNIVLIEDYRIQGYLQAYNDAFEDLTDIVAEDDFVSYKMGVNQIDGKTYGVPFDSGSAGLFYRTDILAEAGYTEEDMSDLTWEEFIEIGKDVKEKTGVYMMTLDPSDLGPIRMMLQSAGSWYTKDDGQTVNLAGNEDLKAAAEIWKDLMTSDIVYPIADWDSYTTAFQTGKVASVPTGCWIAPSIQVADDLAGKWKIAELPRMGSVDRSVNASSIGGGGWYVVKGLPGNDTAKDFLKNTFATSAPLMNQLAEDISAVSTLKAAADTENYKLPSAYFSEQPVFEDFLNWSEEIPAVNYGLHTYAIEDILAEAVQAYVNGGDLDECLQNAQAQAEGAVQY